MDCLVRKTRSRKKTLRNGLPSPPPSNTPIPTGKYSLTNLYKCGTPRFVAIPFKEYLSATRPQPRNELIPPSQNPSSQLAQPSPPLTELVPQSNTPVASTRRDPPSNTPAKRVRLSEQVSPTPPPQGLLPTKHPAPPTDSQFCSRCFAIGCHWVETCPKTEQLPKPADFEKLLRSARRAYKRSRPSWQRR